MLRNFLTVLPFFHILTTIQSLYIYVARERMYYSNLFNLYCRFKPITHLHNAKDNNYLFYSKQNLLWRSYCNIINKMQNMHRGTLTLNLNVTTISFSYLRLLRNLCLHHYNTIILPLSKQVDMLRTYKLKIKLLQHNIMSSSTSYRLILIIANSHFVSIYRLHITYPPVNTVINDV